jgi:predicted DsbA family dithiol-disulfide isomerase
MKPLSVSITYYLDVTSSWCFWVEPAWAQLKESYQDSVRFDWKIALMDATGLPKSRGQCDWFYRRSGTIMRAPQMLNSGWYDPGRAEYLAGNAVAEAARELGVRGDDVRVAIARGAMGEGKKVGEWEVALELALSASNLNRRKLEERARSREIDERLRQTTAEYHAFQMTQRPSFLIENVIGDRSILSGVVSADAIAGVMEAMLADAAAYASYAEHHGEPPPS